MAFKSEKDFKKAVESTVEVLKESYISNIIYVQDRIKDNAEEEELKQVEEIILAMERLIVYFEQSDEWVKNLHDEAKKEVENERKDGDAEVARIEEARNS